MPTFSNDPDKRNMITEAPAFVRFFFDTSRPIALRVGAAAILLVIFFLPLFTSGGRSKKERSAQPPPIVDDSQIPIPEKPEDNSLAELKSEADEQQESSSSEASMLPIATPAPQSETAAAVFHKVVGTFPVPVSVREGSKGTVWIVTAQDITELKNGEAVRKLDGSSYEGIFNSDMRSLSAAAITPDNEMWVGSVDGEVLHYSRYDWKVSWEANEPIRGRIQAIAQHQNQVFFGTDSGLWKFDQASGNLTRYKSFVDVRINTFSSGADGQLLMGAQNGAWRLTPQGWERLAATSRGSGVLSIVEAADGMYFYGTGTELNQLNARTGQTAQALAGNQITALLAGPNFTLWVGLQNGGLRYFDGKDWYAANAQHGAPSDFISELSRDSQGRLWLSAMGKGAYYADEVELLEWIKPFKIVVEVLDDSKPRIYKDACRAVEAEIKNGSSSGDISTATANGETRVFLTGKQICPTGIAYRSDAGFIIARKGSGLIGIANGREQPFDLPKETSAVEIKQIFIDSKNRVWFGRPAGPLLLADGKWEDYAGIPELSNNLVQAIAEDAQGTIWIGTAPAYDRTAQRASQPGLHSFSNGAWKHYTLEQGLPGWTVTSLLRARNGRMIVGTPTGFVFAEKGELITPTLPKKVSISAVMGLAEDVQGTIWMAHLFFRPGLTYYDGAELHPLDEPGRFFSNRIMAIGLDANGKYWLVDPNGGVGVYSREMLLAPAPKQSAESPSENDEASGGQTQSAATADAPEEAQLSGE